MKSLRDIQKSNFTGEITITSLTKDCKFWRLENDLIYAIGNVDSTDIIHISKGFITDGASVARPLQSIFPAWGSWSKAAIIHDFLYENLLSNTPYIVKSGYIFDTFKKCDDIFYEAMIVSRVNRNVALLFYYTVRIAEFIPFLRSLDPKKKYNEINNRS